MAWRKLAVAYGNSDRSDDFRRRALLKAYSFRDRLPDVERYNTTWQGTVRASLLRLHEHPEVGVCFRCVKYLAKRKRAVERMTRAAPPGPWWRRAQYRLGFGRC